MKWTATAIIALSMVSGVFSLCCETKLAEGACSYGTKRRCCLPSTDRDYENSHCEGYPNFPETFSQWMPSEPQACGHNGGMHYCA
ncbi:hypothetical protein Ptr902_07636 [Pyrenophora tritici-repentis]|nr:hypothetical protein Ptr902_07636 [Pyrenophora tritici-repentis]